MPEGHPDVANVTAELKPFAGVIVTVDVPVDPAFAAAAVALSEKLAGTDVPLAGAKKIPLATGLPARAAILIVTFPLIFQTPYVPLWNPEKVRLSSRFPVAASVIVTVSTRLVVSKSRR
jgi:hypothetical protein